MVHIQYNINRMCIIFRKKCLWLKNLYSNCVFSLHISPVTQKLSLGEAQKNWERKVHIVCQNLMWQFILLQGWICFFSSLCLSLIFYFSFLHFYLHNKCISLAQRGSVVICNAFDAGPAARRGNLHKTEVGKTNNTFHGVNERTK